MVFPNAVSGTVPVPDGLQWSDVTGRGWTSHGTDVELGVGDIDLNPPNPLDMRQGSAYNEPGYAAVDAVGNDVTQDVVVDNQVNPNTPGDYSVIYSLPTVPGTPDQVRTVTVLYYVPNSTRDELKAFLDAQFDNIGFESVTVYAYPADVVKAPAVVIDGFDPWILPSTLGGSNRHYQMNFTLRALVVRTIPEATYSNLENLVFTTMGALINSPWKAMEAAAPAQIELNDIEYAQSEISVTAKLEKGTL